MQRFWMSWLCTSADFRPLNYPPNAGICGWWCTGDDPDGNATLCAVVDAPSDGQAFAAIYREWPEAEEYVREFGWRFVEQREPTWIPGDRFPPSEWMVARLARVT